MLKYSNNRNYLTHKQDLNYQQFAANWYVAIHRGIGTSLSNPKIIYMVIKFAK